MHRMINNYPSHGCVVSSSIQQPLVDYHPKSMMSRMATHRYECVACTVARKSLEQPTSPSWRVELTDTRGIVKCDGHGSGHGVILSWSRDDGSSSSSAPKRELRSSKERKRFIGEFQDMPQLGDIHFLEFECSAYVRNQICRCCTVS